MLKITRLTALLPGKDVSLLLSGILVCKALTSLCTSVILALAMSHSRRMGEIVIQIVVL